MSERSDSEDDFVNPPSSSEKAKKNVEVPSNIAANAELRKELTASEGENHSEEVSASQKGARDSATSEDVERVEKGGGVHSIQTREMKKNYSPW